MPIPSPRPKKTPITEGSCECNCHSQDLKRPKATRKVTLYRDSNKVPSCQECWELRYMLTIDEWISVV